MGDMLFGVVIGLLLGFLVGSVMPPIAANKAKAECELTLPRSQECVMVFVPEEIAE